MLLDEIEGQDEAVLYLKKLIKRESIPPLIFYGKKGIGKKSTALALAAAINCDKGGCRVCISCKNLQRHPDIREVKDDNGYIKIETIRELIKESTLSSTHKKRVYIIDNAHFLTQEASASLLKTLESSSNVFILITNSITNLLPTIRSRCFIIRFKVDALRGNKEMEEKLLLWLFELKTKPIFLMINRFIEMDEQFPETLDFLLFLLKKKGFYFMINEVLKTKEHIIKNVNRRLALEKMVLGIKEGFRDCGLGIGEGKIFTNPEPRIPNPEKND